MQLASTRLPRTRSARLQVASNSSSRRHDLLRRGCLCRPWERCRMFVTFSHALHGQKTSDVPQ